MIVIRSRRIARIMTGIVVAAVAAPSCAHHGTTISALDRMIGIASVSGICATSETEAPIEIATCTRRTNMQVCVCVCVDLNQCQ